MCFSSSGVWKNIYSPFCASLSAQPASTLSTDYFSEGTPSGLAVCSQAVPIICHSTYLSRCCRMHSLYIAVSWGGQIESGLSRLHALQALLHLFLPSLTYLLYFWGYRSKKKSALASSLMFGTIPLSTFWSYMQEKTVWFYIIYYNN